MRHLLVTQLRERNPMRQTLLAAAAAFVIGGIATGAVLSQAQQTSPPSQVTDDGGSGPGRTGWAHRMMHQGMMHRRAHWRTFALIYPQQDRQLAPADVQKIAEGFLLWRGNHTWKVSDVAPTADGPIGFNLTTPEGSVVAKFTMDPHTGRIQRVG
jgi:hypothetical protein